MKPTKSLLVLVMVAAPGVAAAQGYYGGGGGGYYQQPQQTAPGGFHNREGRFAYGGSLGLGGMHDAGSNVTMCQNCDYNPGALSLSMHLGGFLSPRFALMGEYQLNAQTVYSDYYNGDTILQQHALMLAGQYWLTPQLWIKGGIGFAALNAEDAAFQYELGQGGAVMGAVGYEVFSARNMAIDLQGRLIQGTYHEFNDSVTSGTVGVGINWY